jgi:heme-degrading monooxygenase HmoA
MIVGILRTRLKPEFEEEYRAAAQHVVPIARTIPGYLSHKSFVADDGERLMVVEYETTDALKAWARHPDHVAAKRVGLKVFSSYRIQVCELLTQRGSDR